MVGIGSDLHGDDSAGLLVARALTGHNDLLVIEAGTAPENQTGALRHFRPDLVLLIDAARMGGAPGEIRLLDSASLDGVSASTHTLPLSLLAQFLVTDLSCRVAVIGIQPGSTTIGAPLTPEVKAAVDTLVGELQSFSDLRNEGSAQAGIQAALDVASDSAAYAAQPG